MCKYISVLLISIVCCSLLTAIDKDRKAISSIETIAWNRSLSMKVSNPERFQKYFLHHLKRDIYLPRFDQNKLPEHLLKSYKEQLSQTEALSIQSIKKMIEKDIVLEIEKIINDHALLEERIKDKKKGERKVTFSETKGKSVDIIKEDIQALINASYIYVPYLTQYHYKRDQDENSVYIEGGVLWYQVKVEEGIKKVVFKTNLKANGYAVKSNEEIRGLINKEEQERKLKTQKVKLEKEAMAMLSALIGQKTKKEASFSIKGWVREVQGKKYKIEIGNEQGVKLDDFYYLMRLEQQGDQQIEKKVGLLQITKTADKKKDYLIAEQRIGTSQMVGTWVVEKPSLGTEISVSLKNYQDLKLKQNSLFVYSNDGNKTPFLKEDIHSFSTIQVKLAYNLAPDLGLSQYFIDLTWDGGVKFLKTTGDERGSLSVQSIFLNLERKIWLNRFNVQFLFGLGFTEHLFSGHIRYNHFRTPFDLYLKSFNTRLGFGAEFLITENWLGFVQCGWQPRLWATKREARTDYDDIVSRQTLKEDINKNDWNPFYIQWGIKYNIPEIKMSWIRWWASRK